MLKLIDTKAIAREQNALKRKYEKAIESINELPMLDSDKLTLTSVYEQAYRNKLNDLVRAAMNGHDIEHIEDAETVQPELDLPEPVPADIVL